MDSYTNRTFDEIVIGETLERSHRLTHSDRGSAGVLESKASAEPCALLAIDGALDAAHDGALGSP